MMIGLNITKEDIYDIFKKIVQQWPTDKPCILIDTFAVTSSIQDLTAETFNKSTVDLQIGNFWSRKSSHVSDTFLKKNYPALLVASTMGVKPRNSTNTCYQFSLMILDEMCKDCPCQRTVEQMDSDLELMAEMLIAEVRRYGQYRYTDGTLELLSHQTADKIRITNDSGIRLMNEEIGLREDVQITFSQLDGLTNSTFRTIIFDLEFCICRKTEAFEPGDNYTAKCCG